MPVFVNAQAYDAATGASPRQDTRQQRAPRQGRDAQARQGRDRQGLNSQQRGGRARGERPAAYERYTAQLPFAMPALKAPQIPQRRVVLTDFGADPTGQQLSTDAFAKAIDQLATQGGGHLVVPQGVWLTGPIVLKSNIDLHLEAGAVIQFAADESLYPVIDVSFEGLDTRRCQSPLSAYKAENISISGQGVIDGNGQYWRPVKRQKVTEGHWKRLLDIPGSQEMKKGYWVPSAGYAKGERLANMNVPEGLTTDDDWNSIKRFLRPVMVSLVGCKNVLLQGVIFQNSPAWNLHPLMCENIIIDDVLVRNPDYAQNGDALDLESCKNALVVNSRFDAGDDGICIKSGKDADGRRRAMPCENVVVSGCTVFAGHGGFVVGSEMSGGVKNIKVSNCQFVGTDVGLRFKSTRGRGGVVEGIWIDNVTMADIVNDAIIFNLYYGGKSVAEQVADGDKPDTDKAYPVDETTPEFRDIHISNVRCSNAGRAMLFNGLPEKPIDGIHLNNIWIRAKKGAEFTNCKGVERNNVNISVQ
ncbi:MAG: glycoside hydrolase family 28 protein [Prevotella sp.]|nr:glycoside hydrolase family 28 protein [Prevotella sp.]